MILFCVFSAEGIECGKIDCWRIKTVLKVNTVSEWFGILCSNSKGQQTKVGKELYIRDATLSAQQLNVLQSCLQKFFSTIPGYTRGVQSRSRAILAHAQKNHDPCPEQLWDSRPCEATSCFTFLWHTGAWTSNGTRDIWCERSDGLNVTGQNYSFQYLLPLFIVCIAPVLVTRCMLL